LPQLPAKEYILRLHRLRRPDLEDDEPGKLGMELGDDLDEREQAFIRP
jgi:hypothetical protein